MRLLFTIAVVSLSANAVLAQANAQNDDPKWQIGAFLQPQRTAYNNANDAADTRYKTVESYGFAAGLSIRYNFLTKNAWTLGAQTEAQHSSEGVNYETSAENRDEVAAYQRHFEYLKVPLLAVADWRVSQLVSVSAGAGVQGDLLMNAQHRKNGVTIYPSLDERARFQGNNLRAVAQAGVQFHANTQLSVIAQIRYDATLTNPDNPKSNAWNNNSVNINGYDKNLPTYTTASNLSTLGLRLGVVGAF